MRRAHLQEAIRLAQHAVDASEGGPFGAVVVQADRIVGRGWNCVTSAHDPTAHAEIVAIRDACRHLNTFSLTGCEIYTSCEPCPMCLAAIYWSRIDGIFYAATRHDAAAAGFDDAEIYREFERPPDRRRLPMVQLPDLQPAASEAFAAWGQKVDRVIY